MKILHGLFAILLVLSLVAQAAPAEAATGAPPPSVPEDPGFGG
jgi:hypothetical protein